MRTVNTLPINGRDVPVSNIDKVMFPAMGFTKGEVLNYYVQVQEVLLPHLKNRPVTLIRFPNGIKGKSFYEKQAPSHTPDWVTTAEVASKSNGSINYILINNLETLVWTVNLANLEMHCFLAQVPKVKSPTSIVFDLDPGPGRNVIDCGELAVEMHGLLKRLKLESFVKTSGSKGMQLYVPLNSGATYDETSLFAKNFAEYLEGQHPDLVVSKMGKNLREKKILIDWSQNSSSKTTACVYSLRTKNDEPYISLPFNWPEVQSLIKKGKSDSFYLSPAEAIKRIKKTGDIFAPLLKMKQKLPSGFRAAKSRSSKSPGSKSAEDLGERDTSIVEYKRKRDFSRTSEPGPKVNPSKTKNLFVIQKHQASHLHFDFRLEVDGVLKSWAVPKGPPFLPDEHRLAMQVEDHPVDYANFEGIIPAGNYGGGTVMVWDTGTFTVETDDPANDVKIGKIDMVLKGTKLDGKWVLIRDKRDPQRWLMLKGKSGKVVCSKKQLDRSALTKRTLDQISEDKDAIWESNRNNSSKYSKKNKTGIKTGASKPTTSKVLPQVRSDEAPHFVEPMKAKVGTTFPQTGKWIYEVKFDGYRGLLIKDGKKCQIVSRNDNDFTRRFSDLVPLVKALPVERAVIDGEIVALTEDGVTSFQKLQNHREKAVQYMIAFYAFDLLHLEGVSLLDQPLCARKAALEKLLEDSDLKYSKSFTQSPQKLLEGVKKSGFEGLIAKSVDSIYKPGDRSADWLKFKVINQQEFVIGGFAQKSSSTFASVLVGYYDGKKLIYVGKLTGGFVPKVRRELMKDFEPLITETCPFSNLPESKQNQWGGGLTKSAMKECTWLTPKLVCMAKYTEWTESDHLRHGSFIALRDDKKARDVGRE